MVNIGPIMFFVPIGRFSVKGGRNITLNTGERLLIGQPHLYENEFREAITENRKFHTETTIRNIERLSHIGIKTLVDLYEEVFGRIGYIMMPSGVVELILRRVRNGQLLALVLPPATRADCVADPKQLENLSGGLIGASAVNPEIADSDDVTFNDLKGMEDKLIYVLKRAPHFITSAKVKKALKEGLSAAAIISVVVVLVAWAASHFFGVGFAIDAILLAIGFVMIGWAIFGAMKKLLKCLKLVKNAESLSDLDKAAEMMADAIVALGVETLIGLLTRGAGRMKAKSSGGNSGGAAGGGKPRTQKEIEADNKAKAKADAARAPKIKQYKDGYSAEQIKAIPKGERPPPSEYLTKDYMDAHLAKFDEGAVRFTSKSKLEEHGTLGPPGGGFALPAKEFDKLMNETGGNLRAVEKKLGLDDGYLSGDDTLIALIKKENLKGVKLPDGNEWGANQFWEPGGVTSGGVSEAIIDVPKDIVFQIIKLGG